MTIGTIQSQRSDVDANVVQIKYHDPSEKDGQDVQFTLLYSGRLPAASAADTRTRDKIRIRQKLHPQLGELWRQHKYLRRMLDGPAEEMANRYQRGNKTGDMYRFVPLIGSDTGTECSLDILFLRRDRPGSLVTHGGDLDNRIKVLLDALRMPNTADEIGTEKPGPGEDPFFCLVSDDQYITDLRVETDRLLLPNTDGGSNHDVSLVIRVTTRLFDHVKGFDWLWATIGP